MTSSSFSETKHLSFALLHISEANKFLRYVKEKQINQRDICVLFAMMSLCDPRTARIKFMVKNLADDLGVNPTSISASLSRLKKIMLVAQFAERNGDKYYMINPYVFSVGRKQRWGLLLQKFLSAFTDNLEPQIKLEQPTEFYDDEEL